MGWGFRKFAPGGLVVLAALAVVAWEGGTSAALQDAVSVAMAGRQGAAIVLDVESGEMLAIHGEEIASRRLAPPGSTIKPFTLLSLLESGNLNPAEPFVCPTQLQLGDYRMDCSHVITARPFNAAEALAYSCNNYFAHRGRRLDNGSFLQTLRRIGFTAQTGLIESEVQGRVEAVDTEEDRLLQALGQKNVLVTPLELASAYRRLSLWKRSSEKAETYDPIFAGLEGATEYGTAQLARSEGLRVAGKTGTSAALDGFWTHAWFAGYAPADDPEIVVVVFLEKGRGGSDAAPIAGEIFSAFVSARGTN